ncbi:hypothetical protein KI387_020468, partial [Taxus chinensis]
VQICDHETKGYLNCLSTPCQRRHAEILLLPPQSAKLKSVEKLFDLLENECRERDVEIAMGHRGVADLAEMLIGIHLEGDDSSRSYEQNEEDEEHYTLRAFESPQQRAETRQIGASQGTAGLSCYQSALIECEKDDPMKFEGSSTAKKPIANFIQKLLKIIFTVIYQSETECFCIQAWTCVASHSWALFRLLENKGQLLGPFELACKNLCITYGITKSIIASFLLNNFLYNFFVSLLDTLSVRSGVDVSVGKSGVPPLERHFFAEVAVNHVKIYGVKPLTCAKSIPSISFGEEVLDEVSHLLRMLNPLMFLERMHIKSLELEQGFSQHGSWLELFETLSGILLLPCEPLRVILCCFLCIYYLYRGLSFSALIRFLGWDEIDMGSFIIH